MQKLIGQLIRTSREGEKLSIADVAAQAHVSVEDLEAFEVGTGNITASALDRIADVLGIDALALRDGCVERAPTATMWFRHGAFADFRDDEDRPKVIKAFKRAAALGEINALLRRPASLRAHFAPEEPTPEAFKDGYRLARRVRRELGNEVAAMGDMVEVLEEQFDILVRVEALVSTRIDALSFREPQSGAAAVILNAASKRRANPTARRVDLAHELGHILFDPWNGKINLVVDQIDEGKSTMHGEQRASAFAAELLLPAEGLRRVLGPPTYEMATSPALEMVERVCVEFQTPIEITVNHLVNREYIVHFQREALIEEARQRANVKNPLAATLESQPHDVLTRRVFAALDRCLISEGAARELLGLTPWDDLPSNTMG